MSSIRKIVAAMLLVLGSVAAMTGPAMAEGSIRIGYVNGWPASSLVTKIAGRIIETRLGWNVDLQPESAASMYEGVATGTLDAHLSAWLPTTHHAYYSQLWDQMINLGPNLLGAQLGIAVPAYAKIDSIIGLKAHASKFDYKIIGVDFGAGININTKRAIEAYDLNMHLVPSSTASMAAALKKAISSHQLIAVTGWKPLWIWHAFDLKLLDDPKRVYGTGDHIDTVVSSSLWDKAPRVFKFLDRFMVSIEEINHMEDRLRAGMPEDKVVKLFLKNHTDKIKMWTHGLTG